MNIVELRWFLFRCLVFNYAVMLLWFLVFVFARDRIFRLHRRWFSFDRARFDAIYYQAMAAYKLLIIVFNVAPLVALLFAG